MFAALQTPTAGAPGPMSIDDAINVAVHNAFSIRLQQSTILRNHYKINEAKASVLPSVTVNNTYTRNQKEVSGNVGGSTPTVFQPLASLATQGQLSFTLDLSGNLGRAIRAARFNERSAETSLDATVNDVRLNTRQAYFAVLRSNAQVAVLEASLKDSQERFAQAEKQYKQQQIARIELMRYQTQVDQAKSDLLTGRNNLELAKNSFNLALARPIESSVELIDPKDVPEANVATDGLVSAGQANRAEVRSLALSLRSLELVRQAQEKALFPSLQMNLNYSRTFDGLGFGQSAENINAQFVLKFTAFDGGGAKARLDQAKQDEVQVKIQLDQTKLAIANDVRAAIANLESAKARFANAQEQVKLAEETFRLAKVKQDAGEGTYVEVIDAQTQLVQARNGLVSAKYDYLTSYAQLQRAVGSDQVPPVVKEPQEANTKKRDSK